jgi:hypothetical protein
MRIVEPPSLTSSGRGNAGDDLDGLLLAFFRAEMPRPWPELSLPEAGVPVSLPARPMPRRRTFPVSRLALAASVALLVVGAWAMPEILQNNHPTTSGKAPVLGDGSAKQIDPLSIKTEVFVPPSGKAGVRLNFPDLPDEDWHDKPGTKSPKK